MLYIVKLVFINLLDSVGMLMGGDGGLEYLSRGSPGLFIAPTWPSPEVLYSTKNRAKPQSGPHSHCFELLKKN